MATAGAGVDCCTLALTGMPCLPSYDCSCSVAAVTGSNSVAEEALTQLYGHRCGRSARVLSGLLVSYMPLGSFFGRLPLLRTFIDWQQEGII